MPDDLALPPALQSLLHEHRIAVGARHYRILSVGNIDELLDSLPDDADMPYWAILWDSAVALSLWVRDHAEALRGKRVLELGTGLGLCAMSAQELGAEVVQTDNHVPALRVAAENARRNGLAVPTQLLADWREWDHDDLYDVILGSDVVYELPSQDLLLRIFRRNLRPGGWLALADPFRESGWEMASRLSREGWAVDLQSHVVLDDAKKPKEILIVQATRGV